MQLRILVDGLPHIKEASSLDNNYYRLPMCINDSDVLYSKCNNEGDKEWSLGVLVNNMFIVNCWLGYSLKTKEGNYIDLMNANVKS